MPWKSNYLLVKIIVRFVWFSFLSNSPRSDSHCKTYHCKTIIHHWLDNNRKIWATERENYKFSCLDFGLKAAFCDKASWDNLNLKPNKPTFAHLVIKVFVQVRRERVYSSRSSSRTAAGTTGNQGKVAKCSYNIIIRSYPTNFISRKTLCLASELWAAWSPPHE